MSDFLDRLVERVRGGPPVVQPVLRTAYEPSTQASPFAAPAEGLFEEDAEHRQVAPTPPPPRSATHAARMPQEGPATDLWSNASESLSAPVRPGKPLTANPDPRHEAGRTNTDPVAADDSAAPVAATSAQSSPPPPPIDPRSSVPPLPQAGPVSHRSGLEIEAAPVARSPVDLRAHREGPLSRAESEPAPAIEASDALPGRRPPERPQEGESSDTSPTRPETPIGADRLSVIGPTKQSAADPAAHRRIKVAARATDVASEVGRLDVTAARPRLDPSVPGAAEGTRETPSVQITIGRLEIRAVQAQSRRVPTNVIPAPHLSLGEYLKRSNGGRP